MAVAVHRAVHQVLEEGRVFADPLAFRILAHPDPVALVREAEQHPARRRMRFFVAARARFAEDALQAAMDRGVRQLVVLGAGLDTFAYRAPAGPLRIFEVDHPATQSWKRDRLKDAAIKIPESLTYAPIDFEQQTLPEGLAGAGFDAHQQTFFTWLGVVPYLTGPAIWSTLTFIAGLKGGSHVVFDYPNPPESLSPEMRVSQQARAARAAAVGEPFLSYFDSRQLHSSLSATGFTRIEDLGPQEMVQRYAPDRPKPLSNYGGHILYASTV